MNDTRLRIYLIDHLALTLGEVELARRCAGSNEGELGDFLNAIEPELIADRRIIEEMLRRVDGVPNMVKEGLAWLAEKFGRLKLNDGLLEYTDLSRLIELDTLHTAAFARCCFWENLKAARSNDERFGSIDFDTSGGPSNTTTSSRSFDRKPPARPCDNQPRIRQCPF